MGSSPGGLAFNKRPRKPKGKSRMDNSETLAALGTQDTGRRKTSKINTTWKTNKISNTDPT